MIAYSLLRCVGYMRDVPLFFVMNLQTSVAHVAAYEWGQTTRTMRVAHEYVQKNWDTIANGDLIDVEYILGETKEKKISQFFSGPRYRFNGTYYSTYDEAYDAFMLDPTTYDFYGKYPEKFDGDIADFRRVRDDDDETTLKGILI